MSVGDERLSRFELRPVLWGSRDLGHEHPHVALDAHEHLIELRSPLGLSPSHADRGLGLVDRTVRLDGRMVLADPLAVEQPGGPVVACTGVDPGHAKDRNGPGISDSAHG